jgi:drug/metabolite transporter (DMT)-like permease
MFLVRFALLSSLFYALNVSMIPLIYSFEVSVFLFLFIRFGTTFCSSIFVTKCLFSFKKIKQQRLGIWVLLLSLLFAVQSWLYVEAVKYMSVGLASVVLFTYPLLTYLIISKTKKRSLDLTTILMFLIAIAGIAAISQSDEGFYTMAIGIILALLSALSYSLILIITPKMGGLRNWEIVKFTTLIPALCFLILFVSEKGFYWPQKEALLLCLVSGTLFAIGMMFYHISVKKYGPIRTANIGYTEPLLVLIFGFIAYLDTITIIQGIGVIMVALASITIEKRQLIQNNTAGE